MTLAQEKAGRAILVKKDKLQKKWKAAHYSGKSTAAIERMLGKLDADLKRLMQSNPGRRAGGQMTKKQRSARASRAAKQRGIIKAVRGLLKKTNPSAKIVGARVVKLKDGVLKITPVKANGGGLGRVLSEYGHQRRGGTGRIAAVKRAIRATRKNPRRRR